MFLSPAQTIAACNLQITDTVADFGAGSGFVARAIASFVTQGVVFAIEINRDLVTRMTREVQDAGIKNIHPLWGDIEIFGGSTLADQSVDVVVLSNILFQLDDKAGCLKEAFRILKKGGKLVVIDWQESFGGLGPHPDRVFTKAMAEMVGVSAGFTKVSENIPGGDHHYGLLFTK